MFVVTKESDIRTNWKSGYADTNKMYVKLSIECTVLPLLAGKY
jgi:hypothetical protein